MALGTSTLGAAPLGSTTGLAPLPSPAQGLAQSNPFIALATAAAGIPAAEAQAKKAKMEAELLKTQVQQAKQQAATQRYQTMLGVAKNNPDSLKGDAFRKSFEDATTAATGLPTSAYETPTPTQPQGGWQNPNAMGPTTPANMAQPQAGPYASTTPQQGPQAPPTSGSTVNLNALIPHVSLTDVLDKNPEFSKTILANAPAARVPILAAYGVTPGSPEFAAWMSAPVKKTASETNADLAGYNSMWKQFNGGAATLASAQAWTRSMGQRLKDDSVDVSQIITPQEKLTMGAAEQMKINAMERAGILNAAQAKAKLALTQAQIENIGSEMNLRGAQANLANTRSTLLPEQFASQAQARLTAADHSAQNLSLRMQEFHQRAHGSNVAAFNKSRSDIAGEASNLRGQINTLQGMAKTLYASSPDAPDPNGAVDQNGQPMTYLQTITAKLNMLQPALDQATNAIQTANHGKEAVIQRSLQSAVGASGTANVIPKPGSASASSSVPAGWTYNGTLPNGKKTYKDALGQYHTEN